MASTREELRELLDALPEDRSKMRGAALESLSDPVLLAFRNAPEDDEPTTAADLEALAEARAEYERGEMVPLDVALAEIEGRG